LTFSDRSAASTTPGPNLTYIDDTRAIRLQNRTCPYCGIPLVAGESDEDHVVARRFVPKGSLETSWNLVLRSCRSCNSAKSDLEDDISAITMHPNAYGHIARDDQVLLADSKRKARGSISRRTKKRVLESEETITLRVPLPGGEMKFEMVAPPQIDDSRAFELARLQLRGFFYWITFDSTESRGYFWPGGFHPMATAARADWGERTLSGIRGTRSSVGAAYHRCGGQGLLPDCRP